MNPIIWFEIAVTDIQRARAFYEQVFQISMQELTMPGMEMYAFPSDMTQHGASGTILQDGQSKPSADGTKIYFYSPDLRTELARVEAAGGKIVMPHTSIGDYGFIALFEDTEGNVVGLHSMPEGA